MPLADKPRPEKNSFHRVVVWRNASQIDGIVRTGFGPLPGARHPGASPVRDVQNGSGRDRRTPPDPQEPPDCL